MLRGLVIIQLSVLNQWGDTKRKTKKRGKPHQGVDNRRNFP